MRIYKKEARAPLPPIAEAKPQNEERQVDPEIAQTQAVSRNRPFIDPCDLLFKPLMGEFLGTLLLDFFAAQLLEFVNENLIITALCTGLIRYILIKMFADCCAGEFNPALTIGKLFCMERGILISIVLIAGQFFGAFIGEVIFATVRPAEAFPFVVHNESETFVDRLPGSFQSYFLIELTNTLLAVVTYLRTGHAGCMGAVTTISLTIAYNAGLETRATGNFSLIFSHSIVATLWNASTNVWRYIEAALAASFIAPFIAAVLYWLLRSARDMQSSEENEEVT